MSEALYRKYRPQIFEDVVGQEHIERTIKNAIEQDKVSHAYLFTGPRGTGKTTTARLVAKALLCEHGPTPEPDGTCSDCLMIAAGEHPDVYELDAASRTGVENVREEIIGRVQFAPTRGRYKVYIIDEVHMLSTAAFNALLKTLEEPPSHVVFILCTTDPQKVPETIHSRCQRFDFRRISTEAIVTRLGAICVSEDVEFEGDALELVAHRAEGGMRNALTSLEQLIAFGEGKVTLEVAERLLGGLDTNDVAEIVEAVGKRDAAACFRWTADYVETGADLAQFTRDFAEHMRNMYVMTLAGADVALDVGESARRELEHGMQWYGPDRLARLLGVLGDLSAELKTSTNPRLSFEIALTRMVRPESDLTLESLAERIEALEAGQAVRPSFAAAMPAVATAATPVVADPMAVERRRAESELGNQALQTSAPQTAQASTAQTVGAAAAVATPVESAPASGQEQAAAPSSAGARAFSSLDESLTNPAALQRMWQSALAALKKNKAAYGVLFLNTKAEFDAGKHMLVIDFPAENSFAYKAVQKPDVQDAVSLALRQASGESLAFCYSQGGRSAGGVAAQAGGATAAATSASSSASSARAASAVRAAKESVSATTMRPQPSAAQANAAQAHVAQTNAPQANTAAFGSVPDPDPIPIDAYDYVPYDDEPYPAQENPAFAQGDVAGRSDAANGTEATRRGEAAVPATEVAAAAKSSALPPEPADAQTSPTIEAAMPASSPDELQAILSAGFGDGVTLEEV